MDAKLRMNAIISMVKAWRLIFYQHALLAPALCQADGFTDDSPRSPWLGGRSVNWQFQYNVTNTNVHPENVLRRERVWVAAWRVREKGAQWQHWNEASGRINSHLAFRRTRSFKAKAEQVKMSWEDWLLPCSAPPVSFLLAPFFPFPKLSSLRLP